MQLKKNQNQFGIKAIFLYRTMALPQIHKWLSYALILAIIAHVAATLWHHFIRKDDTLRRMLLEHQYSG